MADSAKYIATVEGSAKAWCIASDAAVIVGSFNISSGTDNGTGDYEYAYTNNMLATSRTIVMVTPDSPSSGSNKSATGDNPSASVYKVFILTSSTGNALDSINHSTVHGDLA